MKFKQKDYSFFTFVLIYLFMIAYEVQTGDISFEDPPKPDEVLPPKPIIVAPIFVRQKHLKRKMTVYHTGERPVNYSNPLNSMVNTPI